jgi:hypothetical protein
MTNYSQDEDDRRRDRQERADRSVVNSVKIGNDETPQRVVDIEITDDDFRRVALHAHERDITINKMVGLIIKDGLGKVEHRSEHDNKSQLLNEG